MFGYIYKTTIINENSSLHNHFYIGQKQATKIIESYYGSGRKLRDYFNKHCYRKWTRWIHSDEAKLLGLEREILDTAESIDELNKLEEYYVAQELDNPLCLNLMSGGNGSIRKKEVIDAMAKKKKDQHLRYWTNGTEVKLSKEQPGEDFKLGRNLNGYVWFNNGIHNVYCKECPPGYVKGKLPTSIGHTPWNKGLTKETSEKVKKSAEKQKGRKVSQELRETLSIRSKGKHYSPSTEWKKGHKNWNTGLAGTEICKPNKGSFHGEHKGTKWYNNGIKNIRAFTKPEGEEWVDGMLPYLSKKQKLKLQENS